MHRDAVTVVAGHASAQRGLITRSQLSGALASRHLRRRLIDEGWLRRVRPGVYSVGGHRPSPWDPAVAALLAAGPGSVLSHRTAATVHRFPGLGPSSVGPELTVVAPRHPQLSGVVVHRVDHLDERDVSGREPLLFTAAARTVLDLAVDLPVDLLGALVDEGIVAGRWTVDDLVAAMARVDGRGRRGGLELRQVLDARRDEPRVESRLELRVIRALAPLAPFVTQHQVVLDRRVVILDVAWPDRRVGVEVDGFSVHGRSRTRFDADRRRDNRLAVHGWRIVHVTSSMDDATILDTVGGVLRLGPPAG